MNVKLSVSNHKTIFFFQSVTYSTFTYKLKIQHLLYMRMVSAEYDMEIRSTLHAKKSGVLNSTKVLFYQPFIWYVIEYIM